jgi:hypothetical protein
MCTFLGGHVSGGVCFKMRGVIFLMRAYAPAKDFFRVGAGDFFAAFSKGLCRIAGALRRTNDALLMY